MSSSPRDRLIVALDFDSLDSALDLVHRLSDFGCMFKVGSRLFTASGPEAVKKVAALGAGIFLDLKFHDIPHTVAGAVKAALRLPGIRLTNVHALGGAAMMAAAAEARSSQKEDSSSAAKLIAVTVLTSMDAPALRRVGVSGTLSESVLKLSKLAKESGLDGVVASALESRRIRNAFGKDFIILNPGVRPGEPGSTAKRPKDDQVRVATPAEAIRAGADYIVVGRPITAATDPRAAAEAILREMESA
ncbi:MAG TPA: orotidine-5'-phosphate decarboxylase [Candidatus Acidoferrales bacterium]|nr:orotidine-5'-phosphate decarboxylase [Candidatus Acidoferrales bacterium]